MMGEPLFDGISAAVILAGAVAVLLLRSAVAETANPDRSRRLSVIGHVCLSIAVSLLLYRWIAAVTSLLLTFQPNVWRSGALSVACGIGLAAAVKAVIGGTSANLRRNFTVTGVCGVAALSIAATWEWALLVLAMLTSGLALAMWLSQRPTSIAIPNDEPTQPREPVLVFCVCAALLLLLVGTWQHVVEHESHRRTRSPRYSAWPRPSALHDAWERTGWIPKTEDADSRVRVAEASTREQLVATGLGLLLLVVAVTAWQTSRHQIADAETDHAS